MLVVKKKYKSIYKIGTQLLIVHSLIFSFIQQSCKKLVEINSPSTSLTSGNVYDNDATAAAVLTGIYAAINSNSPLRAFSINSISLVTGLSSDELTLFGGSANANSSLVQFYQNRISAGSSNSFLQSIWSDLYSKVYIVNLALERLENSNSLTPFVKQQLKGEAKFLRAFLYFYLINLYGDIPLTTTSDYRINGKLIRTEKAQVFQQISSDLQDAVAFLSDSYVGSDAKGNTVERVRPNKWAAAALLARAYLYMGDWSNAEMQASSVINQSGKYSLTSLNSVFLKNSNEAIWQLQPVNAGWNTEDARVFILPATGPTSSSTVEGYPVYLSDHLLNAFEPNDQRRTNWVDTSFGNGIYYYSHKYKSAALNAPVTEYLMVLRLAEQYLIRAEARVQLNKITEAQDDLNMIRKRAGLPESKLNDHTSLLNAILHERQLELFTEWGHRWLDLKRSVSLDAVMSMVAPTKGTSWNTNWQWWPIPLFDIAQNPNLVQNMGY